MVAPAGIATIRLPAHVQLGPKLGHGQRSWVYRARMHGRDVAVKVYTLEAIRKYRDRYGVDIARFEFERNERFWELESLRPYAARPIGTFGEHGGFSTAFVQEYVEGQRLRELARERGEIPEGFLDLLRTIVDTTAAAGLFDIDLCPRNVMVQQRPEGWRPVLFDFNMMPQHVHAPNPLVALLYRLGLRRRCFRDRRHLRQIARLPYTQPRTVG